MVICNAECGSCGARNRVRSGKQPIVDGHGNRRWKRISLRQTPCPNCGVVGDLHKLLREDDRPVRHARRPVDGGSGSLRYKGTTLH